MLKEKYLFETGIRNLLDDVEFMLDRKTSVYWKTCWAVVTPLILIVIDLLLHGGYFITFDLQRKGLSNFSACRRHSATLFQRFPNTIVDDRGDDQEQTFASA